jgi:hypothetical protein
LTALKKPDGLQLSAQSYQPVAGKAASHHRFDMLDVVDRKPYLA